MDEAGEYAQGFERGVVHSELGTVITGDTSLTARGRGVKHDVLCLQPVRSCFIGNDLGFNESGFTFNLGVQVTVHPNRTVCLRVTELIARFEILRAVSQAYAHADRRTGYPSAVVFSASPTDAWQVYDQAFT